MSTNQPWWMNAKPGDTCPECGKGEFLCDCGEPDECVEDQQGEW